MMYRNGETMPGNYYTGGPNGLDATQQQQQQQASANNGWYWDGTQYQQYYYNSQEGGAVAAGPPDLVAIPNEEDPELSRNSSIEKEDHQQQSSHQDAVDVSPPAQSSVAGSLTTHEEHYAFYEKQLDQQQSSATVQPPDVLQRGEPLVPSSDRNLFMETGHLDAVGVPPPPPPLDRLVLGENEETRFVPGINSRDEQPPVPRSEAVGADRQEEGPSNSSNPSPPAVVRNVEGGRDEESKSKSAHSDGPEDEEDPDDEEEDGEREKDIIIKEHRRSTRGGEPNSSSGRNPSHQKKREGRHRRNYSPEEEHRRSNRRREEQRRTVSPPSSDEYQRGPSRRNSRRYSSKYSGSNNNNNKSYRGNDSYYYDDHASMRSDRSYVEDRRRSHHHHHNRSLYYDYPSRPSSRASNYDYDYARSSRRHYPHDPYYGNAYGPATAAPMPDPALLESFRKNWEYYSRNPAQMEALRISNPIQHATLLRYYQMYSHLLPAAEPQGTSSQSQVSEQQQSNGMRPSSRNSVHSGQSSIADHFPRPLDQSSPSGPPVGQEGDMKQQLDGPPTDPSDITPLKFCAPHVNGSIGANGILALVHAKNPKIGQTASVDLIPLVKKMSEDVPSHTRNLKEFPGPLIPGRTHKGEVIRFCQNKISAASVRKDIVDKDSYILLWELLILLLKQKNAIDGSDIAELLLKDRSARDGIAMNGKRDVISDDEDDKSIAMSNDDFSSDKEGDISHFQENQSKITAKFRDYLLYGHKKEGLEYAMKHGLWGHALFLASKMDERSYSNVMVRFANGIAVNDPLQTLYQQMSGRQPIAMKECAESSWGDWRPHLAMILSNPSQKSGLDHKSIMTLGDTLYEKGYLYASQFCYLMINLELGYYSDGATSKLVLIGADHLTTNFKSFTSNVEAVQCTEIFEYVQKLSQPESGGINSFVFYKYLYTLRLLDFGCTSTALHYLEIIADTLSKKINDGSVIKCDYLETNKFMNQVLYLADRLKYLDPKYTTAEGEKSEIGDPEWLVKFRNVLLSLQYQNNSTLQYGEEQSRSSLQNQTHQSAQPPEQQQQSQYTQVEYNGQMYYYDGSTGQYYLIQNEQEAATAPSSPAVVQEETPAYPHHPEPQSSIDSLDAPPMIKLIPESEPTPPHPRSRQESLNNESHLPQPSSGAMPPPIYTTVNEEKSLPSSSQTPPTSQPKAAPNKEEPPKNKDNSKKNAKTGGGLLGRIFGRLVSPPNQVHLPDDKDGSIVWDEKKKRWVDSSADPAEEEAANAPPPSDSDLLKKSPQASKMLGPPGAAGGNKYSGKGARGLRGRVDVFKNSMSAPSLSSLAVAPPPLDHSPIAPPPPIEESVQGNGEENNSSSSPVYEEEGSNHPPAEPPMFYNPSQFQSMTTVGKTRRNKYV